ncbi:MAG: NAD(P)H-dependent glycerol-3-phosphate dehydrogenase [bacterium]
MKISVIGGGSWGVALGQVLIDNNHEVLIYDINKDTVNLINNDHKHPFFDCDISDKIVATNSLEETLNFSDNILLSVPTSVMRLVTTQINDLIKNKKTFISVSKGIEPETLLTISQICNEVLGDKMEGFVTLCGPSHAEEVILRQITALVSASTNNESALLVQKLFSNESYMRVYTSTDVLGVEICSSVKNAIAVISGIASGLGHGENARAALITRGIVEMSSVLDVLGGKKETVFGLTGIGDLIVTASSLNSRNFKAGLKIGQGEKLEDVLGNSKMVVEGVRTVISCNEVASKYNLDLPLITTLHKVLYEGLDPKVGLNQLLSRKLKSE